MRASDFVKKRPTKTLTIFDIDDTLFHTTAKIKVVKDGKVIRTLTNQQFNNYELQPGEEFDFGEFRDAKKFAQESEPIEHMMDELKTILAHSKGTVIMLTARADFDDKATFLKTFTDHGVDMSRVHVHRAGNLPGDAIPAEKKAVWVRRYLDTNKYNQVSLYDDSMTNLRVFKSLKKEYPNVDFDAYYITPDDVAAVEGRGKRKRKPKYAYGAPWGWYGMDTGYSSDAGGGGDGGGMEEMRKLKKFKWSSRSRFSNLEDNETTEASYPGNIGAMEVFKFMQSASQDQIKMLKKLIDEKEYKIAWALIQGVTGVKLQGDEFSSDIEKEDYHPNDKPAGPEFKPTMPAGTVRVDVSDVYDWYKLGQHISNMKGLGKHDFGKGPPSTILSFGSEDEEHEYIQDLFKLGLKTTDIDPASHKKLRGQKTDPTFNVDEHLSEFSPAGGDGGDNYGGDLHDILLGFIKDHYPKIFKKFGVDLVSDTVSNMVVMGSFDNIDVDNEDDLEDAVAEIYSQLEDQENDMEENFADGKNPGRKGLAKRSGVPTKASVSSLRKIAKSSSGEKQRMAHWLANMKSGKSKK